MEFNVTAGIFHPFTTILPFSNVYLICVCVCVCVCAIFVIVIVIVIVVGFFWGFFLSLVQD